MNDDRRVFHMQTASNAEATSLVPASSLEDSNPALFRKMLEKYDDTPERRRLPETWIPILNARWIDVVFLSPVHPRAIWEAWRDIAGIKLPSQRFWAIPVSELGRAIVFDRQKTAKGDPIAPSEVTELDPGNYRAAMSTTQKNRDWIAKLHAEHRRGAWHNGTPHVLTPGPVPLHNADVIDWADPLTVER